MEFHPAELPADYRCGADPENPFLLMREPVTITKRKCACGNEIVLHVEYNPNNRLHDLCDDCILKIPVDPGLRYPAQTIQIAGSDGVVYSDGENE